MTIPVLTFFNNKGGVGKTSLIYHLAWMYSHKGLRVLAADFDPQANLTAAFLDEEFLEQLWPADGSIGNTVFGGLSPLIRGVGDIAEPQPLEIADRIALLAGDLALSGFEDDLSSQWSDCLDAKERAFRVISAFWRLLMAAAEPREADVVLVDVGPNLGAINRAALVAADYVVLPLAPDLFSVQGLQNLGPRLRQWRAEWASRLPKNPEPDLRLPAGRMQPLGYILLQHGVRLGQPVQAYQRWMRRIPDVYREAVLATDGAAPALDDDPNCLAQLKHYRSLMPLSQEANKPVFDLKPADGAFGGHQAAVSAARSDFSELADTIMDRINDARGGNPQQAATPAMSSEPRGAGS